MKWWRSRYVQHLEAENAELRETVKRMLNPQWRYLLYGEQALPDPIPGSENYYGIKREPAKEHVKLPGRRTWSDIRSQVEYLVSPQAVIDRKQSEREEHLHAINERIS